MNTTPLSLIQEIDPNLVRGLRYLHSTDPGSTVLLKQLCDQAIIDKYGSERKPVSILNKINLPSSGSKDKIVKSREDGPETKRPKMDSKSSYVKAKSLFDDDDDDDDEQGHVGNKRFISSDEDNNDKSDDDYSIFLPNESSCTNCKLSTSHSSNKLVECMDCHCSYHQQCHFPPITDMDLNDPRFVWYCSSCEQSINSTTASSLKMLASGSKYTGKSSPSSTSKNVSKYGLSSSSKSLDKYSSSETKASSSISIPSFDKKNLNLKKQRSGLKKLRKV